MSPRSELYVKPGLVPADMGSVATRAQQRRQQVEYALEPVTAAEAWELISAAERFVTIVERSFAE